MQRQLKIIFWLTIIGVSTQFAAKGDTEAQKLLRQSEAALAKAGRLKISCRAFQEHVSGAPELGMAGSFIFEQGNRFHLTNAGVFFIFDSEMECVSDGTNYLAVIAPRTIQWERNSVRTNFNPSIVHSFVVGGATPIIASQLVTALMQDEKNSIPKLLPFLDDPFSVSGERIVGDEMVNGKKAKHIELTLNNGTNDPVQMDLWLDEATSFPIKRTTRDKLAGDVFETYRFELNPNVLSNIFAPKRIIQSRKLEAAIQQMETPDGLLLKACRNGDIKLATSSLAKGANATAKTSFTERPPSFSPLMFAAKAGNFELVKLLVEHGAEINAGASRGATPLQFACMKGDFESVKYLIQHGAVVTNATASLSWAAWRGYSNIVVLLVEKGVPINQPAGEVGAPLQRLLMADLQILPPF